MHPVLLDIGVKLHSYGFMIAVGFLVAVFLIQRDAKQAGLNYQLIGEMAFWALFWGVVGTRILHVIMYPEGYSWSRPLGWFAVWNGGLVFQGAIPASFTYAIIRLRHHKIPFWPVADIGLCYVPLAQASGRIGCVLNGCCFGQRADDLPWAVCFPKDSPAYLAQADHYAELSLTVDQWSYPVHPTQIYSALGLLLICLTLVLIRKRKYLFVGIVMPLYFIFYGIVRFIVEMYRGDGNPRGWGFNELTNQQVICILMVIAGTVLFAILYKRHEEPKASYALEEVDS